MAERTASLQSQLSAIDRQLARVSRKDQATLSAKRDELAAALELALATTWVLTGTASSESMKEAGTVLDRLPWYRDGTCFSVFILFFFLLFLVLSWSVFWNGATMFGCGSGRKFFIMLLTLGHRGKGIG